VHATAAWSREHLEAGPEEVAAQLADVACALTGVTARPRELRAHRWRYALVERQVGAPCLYDGGLGVCGDGLLGGRIESALVSGIAVAGRVLGGLRAAVDQPQRRLFSRAG
jgi:predicted NAD/FAD-dependent oxidoreductase